MNNNYFYSLRLPFEFNKEIPDFKNVKHVVYDKSNVPELVNWLAMLGVEIEAGEVFKKTPEDNFKNGIHVDGRRFDNHAKINFIVNSGKSKMRWWSVKEGYNWQEEITVIGTPYRWARREECDLAAETEMHTAMLVNAGTFHNVEEVDMTRYCFSFRLVYSSNKQRVLWPELFNIFKDYINE